MSGRNWIRLTLIVLGVGFLLGSVVAFVLRVKWRHDLERALVQFHDEVGPLDPRRVAPPEVATTSENAASWLIAAATALLVDGDSSATLRLAREPVDGWTEEQREAVQPLLDAHPEVLMLAARAVPLDRSNFGARYVPDPLPGDELGIGPRPVAPDPVVDLLSQLRLSSFLRLAVVSALETGDCEAAADRLEVAARQVRTLLAERMVIFGLIGSSASIALVEDSADLATRCGLGAEASLERALAAVERVVREAEPADEMIRGEAASNVAQMSVMLARERSLPMRLFGEAALGVQAVVIDHWRELVVATRGGAPDLRRWSEAQRQVIGRPGSPGEIITAMLTPNLVDAALKLHLGDASRRLAVAALTLRLEGLRDGGYPSPSTLPQALLAPTPYLGETIVVEPRADGGVLLALPESAEDWDTTHPEHVRRPRLTWNLPPLP